MIDVARAFVRKSEGRLSPARKTTEARKPAKPSCPSVNRYLIGTRRTEMSAPMNYLDGNAAAGELSRIFVMDVTTAEGQCAHCGAIKRFAEAHLYMHAPGVVARCAVCQHVLLRLVSVRDHVILDVRGMAYFSIDSARTP